MLAQEIMTTPVITVRPDTPVTAAAGILLDNDITAAPVVDDAGRLVGILSELDLVKREVEADPRAHLRRIALTEPPAPRVVEDVMTRAVLALPLTTDVGDVVALMVDERVKSIPIVDGQRVAGIVSRRDVLRMLVRDDDAIRMEVERRVAEVAGRRPHLIEVDEGIVAISTTGDETSDTVAVLAARTVPGVIRVHLAAAHRQ
ncbi:MAG: CBS domain-containing protein [Frankiaceae bacterium]